MHRKWIILKQFSEQKKSNRESSDLVSETFFII